MNFETQNYRGLNLSLNKRDDYIMKRAKEFNILSPKGYSTEQKIWIPNSFLAEDGTVDQNRNFMFLFNKSDVIQKLFNAGYEIIYK